MRNKLSVGLLLDIVLACKPTVDTAPVSPLLGQWRLHRIIYSGFPTPFTRYNRIDSTVNRIGQDEYTFTKDYSYRETGNRSNTFLRQDFAFVDQANKGTWIPQNTQSQNWQPTDTLREVVFQVDKQAAQSVHSYSGYRGRLTPTNELMTSYVYSFYPKDSLIAGAYDELVYYRKTFYYRKVN